MSLHERELREHLDRRAAAHLTDPDDLAEAVIARLPAVKPARWWQNLGGRTRGLGLAAAGVAGVIIAVAVMMPSPTQSPGSSSTPSNGPQPSGYPAERPMTTAELVAFLGEDSTERAGAIVVADVQLDASSNLSCVTMESCPSFMIRAPGPLNSNLLVVDRASIGASGQGTYAFEVRAETLGLDLIAPVTPASDALAWTLADYLAELPSRLATDRLGPQAYVVEAAATQWSGPPSCPSATGAAPPVFDVGCGVAAWLLPVGTDTRGSSITKAPAGGLRIQNGALGGSAPDIASDGFFLVRPLGVDSCFLCTPGATSQYLGAIEQIEPSAPTASATPLIDNGAISVLDLSFSTNAVALDGLETRDITLSVTFGGDVVSMGQMDLSTTPLACLTRERPATGSEFTSIGNDFTRVAGTNTWEAMFRFTSSQAGTWHVTCLQAHDADGKALGDGMVGIDPFALGWSPALTVAGTHRPTMTMEFNPDPGTIGQPLEVFGRVADENGAPFAGVDVTIGRDNVCAEGGAGETVTTDTNGNYSHTIDEADEFAVCAWLLETPGVFPSAYQAVELNAVYATLLVHPDVR